MRAAARCFFLAAALLGSRCFSLMPANPLSACGNRQAASDLHAVTKRQTFILDGAELAYYASHLLTRSGASGSKDEDDPPSNNVPNVAPRARRKRDRVGSMCFVTASLDDELRLEDGRILGKSDKVLGVAAAAPAECGNATVSIGDADLYRDSLAVLPSSCSETDAISTASASLLGVHCGGARGGGKVVIVGGGDYAAFLAAAHAQLGRDVALVSAQPKWALPRGLPGSVEVIPPSVGKMKLPFSSYIGKFDTIIDTIGDETGLGRAMNVADSVDTVIRNGLFGKKLQEYGCNSYISTLTRSQQYVSQKGVLRARDSVVRYQKECESKAGLYQALPPPESFGTTLQQLLDGEVVYRSDGNENGAHAQKSTFVRGWSLKDSTEMKTWPREGSTRYGFPSVDISLSTLRTAAPAPVSDAAAPKKKEAAVASVPAAVPDTTTSRRPQQPKVRVVSPHVTSIESVADLERLIVGPRRRCILFVTAGFCQKCHRLRPQFNRIARVHAENSSSKGKNGVMFAQVDTSSGPQGKQLAKVLNAERIPSVIVFRDGQQIYGKAGAESPGSGSIVVERRSLEQLPEVVRALNLPISKIDVEALLSRETFRKCSRANELKCNCVKRCALVVSDTFRKCRLDCSCTDRCVLGVV